MRARGGAAILDIEEIAAAILAEHDAHAVPVPVEQVVAANAIVARNHFDGIESSFALRHGTQQIVGVNTRTSPRRQRFAIAHAYGHLVLHHEPLIACRSVNVDTLDGVGSSPTAEQEFAANWFAGALLIPRDLVCAELGARNDLGKHASRDALIADVARTFEVSNEAMGWRLIHLNLIGG